MGRDNCLIVFSEGNHISVRHTWSFPGCGIYAFVCIRTFALQGKNMTAKQVDFISDALMSMSFDFGHDESLPIGMVNPPLNDAGAQRSDGSRPGQQLALECDKEHPTEDLSLSLSVPLLLFPGPSVVSYREPSWGIWAIQIYTHCLCSIAVHQCLKKLSPGSLG